MPGRIRRYNAMQALYISNQILGTAPFAAWTAATPAHCDACGKPIDATAIFCNHCGATINHSTLSTQPSL